MRKSFQILAALLFFLTPPILAKNSFHEIDEPGESKASEKEMGINAGGVYKLKDGTILRVKERYFKDPEKDSLIVSYLTSRLLQFLTPNQVATVVIVNSKDGKKVGSYDIPNFKARKSQDSLEGETKLNLALDLMDIQDRHHENIGKTTVKNLEIAVAVDLDMSELYDEPWLFSIFTHAFYPKRDDFKKSLADLVKIPDEKIISVFSMGIRELENALMVPKLSLQYNVDFILSKVLETKHQMEWAEESFDKFLESLSGTQFNLPLEIQKKDIYGFYLIRALKVGDFDLAKSIANFGAKDPYFRVLSAAAKHGDLKLLEGLLEKGFKDKLSLALNQAVSDGNLPFVETLMKHGSKDLDGHLLYRAASNLQDNMLYFLIEKGSKDKNGSALYEAVRREHIGMVRALVKNGSIDFKGGALQLLVRYDETELVALLLKNKVDSYRDDLLQIPIEKNNIEMLRLLLTNGIRSSSALWYATLYNRLEMVRMLLDHGHRDTSEKPLVNAISAQNFEMVRLLFERIDYLEDDPTHLTFAEPFAKIAYTQNEEMALLFFKMGAKSVSSIPLIHLVVKNNLKLLEIFLKNGAEDSMGTSLAAAERENNLPALEMLLKYGIRDTTGNVLVSAIENKKTAFIKLLREFKEKEGKEEN